MTLHTAHLTVRIAALEEQVEGFEAKGASVDASVGSAFGEISLELEKERKAKITLAKVKGGGGRSALATVRALRLNQRVLLVRSCSGSAQRANFLLLRLFYIGDALTNSTPPHYGRWSNRSRIRRRICFGGSKS